MFKERMYKILVKDCDNDFVLGHIMGMIRALSDTGKEDSYEYPAKGFNYSPELHILRFKANYWNYRKIRKELERHYPDMIVFIQ
jgi:hypothetical protein